jgi:hypothetical protein
LRTLSNGHTRPAATVLNSSMDFHAPLNGSSVVRPPKYESWVGAAFILGAVLLSIWLVAETPRCPCDLETFDARQPIDRYYISRHKNGETSLLVTALIANQLAKQQGGRAGER